MPINRQLQPRLAQSYLTSIQNFVRYFVELVQQEQPRHSSVVDEQLENIVQALHLAYAHGMDDLLVTGANAAYPLLAQRGQFDHAMVHLQRAETGARRQADPRALLATLLHLAQADQRLGHQQGARARLIEGIMLAEQAQAFEQATLLYQELAHLLSENYELGEAIVQLNQAIVYARRLDRPQLLAELLADWGWLALLRTSDTEATVWLQEALAILPRQADPARQILIQGRLGVALLLQLRPIEAVAALQESLARARSLHNIEGICFALSFLGTVSVYQGNFADAERMLGEAYEIACQGSITWIACFARCRLGEMEMWRGNYAQARHFLDEGLSLAEQFPATVVEQRRDLLVTYAEWAIRQNFWLQAERYLEWALPLARLLDRPLSLCTTLNAYGQLRMQQANWPAAEQAYHESLAVALNANLMWMSAHAKHGLAKVYHAQGDIDAARRLGMESLAVLEQIKHAYVAEVRQWLSTL